MAAGDQYNTAFAVTPSDGTSYTAAQTNNSGAADAFIVGVGGTVTFVPSSGGAAVQITAVAGTVYPIRHKRINATGTAATGIVALNV